MKIEHFGCSCQAARTDRTSRSAWRSATTSSRTRVSAWSARALARRGSLDGADDLLREAAEIVEPTDYVIMHIDLAFARADVNRPAGRKDGERHALERAIEVSDAKGNRVAAERARRWSAELSGTTPGG